MGVSETTGFRTNRIRVRGYSVRRPTLTSREGGRMALSAGTRLGPYEILAPLGAGATGEVYRPNDTCLGRTHLEAVPS